MYSEILYEVADPIATITLNRPSALNAWTARMGVEVKHAVAAAEADKRVVAIVLTGAGRGFCAGADLSKGAGTFAAPAAHVEAMYQPELMARTNSAELRIGPRR